MKRYHIDAARQYAIVKAQMLDAYPELAEDEQALLDTLEGETDLNEVVTRLLNRMDDDAGMAEVIKARKATLDARQKRFETRVAATRAAILALMQEAEAHKLTLPEGTVSVGKSRPGYLITDEGEIPSEYIRTKTEPDKGAIGKAIKNGTVIPGVEAKNGAPTLTIRRA